MGKANLAKKMRTLHRCLGFFVAGLMLMYSITGLVLVYRNTDMLKHEIVVEKQLPPGMTGEELGAALRMKNYKAEGESAGAVVFKGGSYDKATGKAIYKEKSYYAPMDKMVSMHKIVSANGMHWIGVFSALALVLLVLTSFFMLPTATRQYKSGMVYAVLGLIVAVAAIWLC